MAVDLWISGSLKISDRVVSMPVKQNDPTTHVRLHLVSGPYNKMALINRTAFAVNILESGHFHHNTSQQPIFVYWLFVTHSSP